MGMVPPDVSITISPDVAYPGDKIMMLATGFLGFEPVLYEWTDIKYHQTINADSKGVINAIITIDQSRAPGRYHVNLTGSKSGLSLGHIVTILPKGATPQPPIDVKPDKLYQVRVTSIDGSLARFILTSADFAKLLHDKDARVQVTSEKEDAIGPPNSLSQVNTWLNQHGLSTTPPGPSPPGSTTPPGNQTPGPTTQPPGTNLFNVSIPAITLPSITIPGLDTVFADFKKDLIDGVAEAWQKALTRSAEDRIQDALANLRIQNEIARRAKQEGLIT